VTGEINATALNAWYVIPIPNQSNPLILSSLTYKLGRGPVIANYLFLVHLHDE
jgi:hypothetical protein